ncbi:hypothetical protein ILUMI_01759 [Ignelater luminosus]|uniref:Serine protease K12H4.7 n=1 Tax=Ignelater luminosus TaxID=2038154 RepID=A0A8K0DHV3_IGNLU|nr:hypothetical protein ILUMI_01759 [Ignelater luminosus]
MIVLIFIFLIQELYSYGMGDYRTYTHRNDGASNNSHVTIEWFTQILDHFNPVDDRKWQQRFFTNNQFYDHSTGGPVFLMIGGEDEAYITWMTQGAWIDYAKKFKAFCFQLEHRYYGKSHATKDLSIAKLRYLNVEQALADSAQFIFEMNKKYQFPANTKWIVFGGSYSGSLAAWMRLKYPHLVYGAVSSSSILLAVVEYSGYLKTTYESLKTYSNKCVDAIQEGFFKIDSLLHGDSKSLNKIFQLCDPIEESLNNTKDIQNLHRILVGSFVEAARFNNINEFGSFRNTTINSVCNIMENKKLGSPIDRVAAVNRLSQSNYGQNCVDFKYKNMLDFYGNISYSNETCGKTYAGRPYKYQECTQFGHGLSSAFEPPVFGNHLSIEFFTQVCVDLFGPEFNSTFIQKAVDRTNMFYGGLDIDITRVIFIQGSIDPWHPLGLLKTRNPKAHVIFINGTAHMADFYPKSDKDLPQLTAAREQIVKYISEWLKPKN